MIKKIKYSKLYAFIYKTENNYSSSKNKLNKRYLP